MAENILDRFKNVKSESVVDTDRKVRVGIIGCGWIAEAHVLSYLNQPDVEIVAGADLIPGKAEKFFTQLGVEGVKYYGHHTEMLVVQDDHFDRDIFGKQGAEFLNVHLERTVAAYCNRLSVRRPRLCSHCSRDGITHGSHTA